MALSPAVAHHTSPPAPTAHPAPAIEPPSLLKPATLRRATIEDVPQLAQVLSEMHYRGSQPLRLMLRPPLAPVQSAA
jgi:hypothetical protein